VALGVDTLGGDIANATELELAEIFEPFDTVVGCSGMTCPAGTQVKIARAVLKAQVRRYLPWQFGVDYDVIGRESEMELFTEQLDVRDLLRGQEETKWVVVSTGMFMSFLFWPGFGVVGEGYGSVRALGGWGNRVTVTAVGDIGRVVAEILCEAPKVQGVVYTAGETVSYGRLAEIVEEVTGKGVERREGGLGLLREELEKDPRDGLRKYRVVFGEGRGVAWDEGGTFNKQRGMEMVGVKGWLSGRLNK